MYNQFNRLLYLSAIIFLSSTWVFVGCTAKDKDKNETTETVTATQDKPSEWQMFKESSEKTIANNEERIQTLKDKIKNSKTPNIDKLREKRIDALEQQNTELRSKIMEYKADEMSADWMQFKADVQKKLDEIEASFKSLDDGSK